MYRRCVILVATIAAVSCLLVVHSAFTATTVSSGEQASQSIFDSYQSRAIAPCTDDGKVEHWSYGQANPPDGNDFVAIAAGINHSLALKSDGSVIGWGSNVDRCGTYIGQASPPDDNDFIAIAAGSHHSLALKSVYLRSEVTLT